MQCAKCNSVNPPEAKFCGKCGERLAQTTPPVPPPFRSVEPAAASEETVSDGLKLGIAVGSGVFPLLGIVMGAVYMNSQSPAKKKVGKLWLYIGLGAAVLWYLYSQS
ncbi:MAG: zinc ribbon domain-containing protein [Nibricoccus sp.]